MEQCLIVMGWSFKSFGAVTEKDQSSLGYILSMLDPLML